MSFGIVQAEKMTTESGYSLGAGNASSFKNRIINGGQVIDQRNAGASINNDTSGSQFATDRWNIFGQQSAKFSAQQSTTVPAGFRNSLLLTSLSAYTPLTGDRFILRHKIEGYNMADWNWGTANAKTVTFSFWARSSLTGTFGGVFMNDTQARCFPFTYTIDAANTWEQKTVTVVGDTTGTWETGSLTGLQIWFSLGAGATYVAPSSGSWIAGNYTAPPGAQNLVQTSGATLYITGVQIEVGTVATSFDYRDFGREFMLCQRYFCSSGGTSVPVNGETYANGKWVNTNGSVITDASGYASFVAYPVAMRTAPTITIVGNSLASSGQWSYYSRNGGWSSTTANGVAILSTGFQAQFTISLAGRDAFIIQGGYTASAEL